MFSLDIQGWMNLANNQETTKELTEINIEINIK